MDFICNDSCMFKDSIFNHAFSIYKMAKIFIILIIKEDENSRKVDNHGYLYAKST